MGFKEPDYAKESYKKVEPGNISGIDNIHLESDCVDKSILEGTRQLICTSFTLDKFPGYEKSKEARTNV